MCRADAQVFPFNTTLPQGDRAQQQYKFQGDVNVEQS
jgi:hypothetical protein